MFYSLILKIKIIYLPKTQQIYKCIASGSRHQVQQPPLQPPSQTTTIITRSSNKFQIQKPQPKKKKNSKSSTKPQPNRSINDQTQPTISGEIGGESCGGRRAKNGDCGGRQAKIGNGGGRQAKIGDCPWASRASNQRAELQIGELQSTSSASDRNRLLRDRKRKREK